MKQTNFNVIPFLIIWIVGQGCMPYHPNPTRVTTGPVPTFRQPDSSLCHPQEVLDRAIQARGGEALLKRLQTAYFTGDGLSAPQNQVAHFKFRTTSVLPNRTRDETDYDGGLKFIQVLDRDKGWVSNNGNVKGMDAVNLQFIREQLYINQLLTLVPLREKNITLEALPQRRLEGVIAQGFIIKSQGQRDVTLYFEKENGLPLMVKAKAIDPNTLIEHEQETYFTGYANLHGIEFPKRWNVYHDGNKSMELNFEDFKFLDKVEDILFTKP